MIKHDNHTTYALVGGYSAGPVMPLLAVRDALVASEPSAQFILIDVVGSVSERIAPTEKIPFIAITAGKLRRYFSWRTVIAPFQVLIGFFQSIAVLRKHKVTQVIGAGGFVQVPVMWAAWILGTPVHIHQQDMELTLANKVCAPIASSISVTFELSLKDFSQGSGIFSSHRAHKALAWTGNPVREQVLRGNKAEAQKFFKLDSSWPTLLIIGGGTGAQGLNDVVYKSLPELIRTVQIIHSTGKGKQQPISLDTTDTKRYHPYEFITHTNLAYAAADIVISRAGLGTITELANIGKASIIIPMPHTHQELNALLLYEQGAAIIMDQRETTPDILLRVIRKLLFDLETQKQLAENIKKIMPHQAAQSIARLIEHH